MRRRGFIVGAGVALSTLAGCLGSEQATLSERPRGNAVEDGIKTAIGESNTVALKLSTARADAQSPAEVSFDVDALDDRIADARSVIDAAAQEDVASDFQAELDAATAYADVIDGLLGGSSSLADVAGQLQGLDSSMQTGSYDTAAGTIEAVQPTVESARTTTTEAQSSAQDLDAERLDSYGAKLTELRDGLVTVQNGTVGADELVTGYDALLGGRSRLQTGRDAVERQEFATAQSAFEAANSQFETATDHFRTAREETDGELSTHVDVALCRSDALSKASVHFENSASAAQELATGETLRERRDGEADLEAATNCG